MSYLSSEQIVDVPVPQCRRQNLEVIQIVDVAVREIPERIVDVVKVGLRERVQQHTGQILDTPVLQERFREDYGTGGQYFFTTSWEHIIEVPQISSQDRILQRSVEQVLDVPVPPMMEEVVEVSKIVYQDPRSMGARKLWILMSIVTPQIEVGIFAELIQVVD